MFTNYKSSELFTVIYSILNQHFLLMQIFNFLSASSLQTAIFSLFPISNISNYHFRLCSIPGFPRDILLNSMAFLTEHLLVN